MTDHFEAKLHGFRRTQDGVVISYVVNPHDVSAEMATAVLGTRYMIAFSEIGDNGKPVAGSSNGRTSDFDSDNAGSTPAPASKERKPFDTLPLPQQAGIRCGDAQYAMFLMDTYPSTAAKYNEAADVIRDLCGVPSRAELASDKEAVSKWNSIEANYQDWLTERKYKDSYR